jgi:2-oxoglutarate dehydrogenase E2 component (dihydrolipoamide succinyltransferase)
MILEMKVPSPGESIKEVEIATWLVKDGDYVEKDQAIAEVDSDKATLELPAEASGIITLKAEEGDAVAVGAVVCLIDTSAAKPNGAAPVAEVKAEAIELQTEAKLKEQKELSKLKSKEAEQSTSFKMEENTQAHKLKLKEQQEQHKEKLKSIKIKPKINKK